jgi:hypothetical protein
VVVDGVVCVEVVMIVDGAKVVSFGNISVE